MPKARSQVISESLHDIRRAVEMIRDAVSDLELVNPLGTARNTYSTDTLNSLAQSILDIVNGEPPSSPSPDAQPIGTCSRCGTSVYYKLGFCGVCRGGS